MELAGIEETNGLGRYLGVPAIHGCVNQSLFTTMLEHIDKKLDGWKNRYLSLAWRCILAKTSLSSIPYFAMQSTLLPLGICNEIDKRIIRFLWNGNHLVNSNTVTKAKHKGGTCLRRSRDMNVVFLAKVGWRFLKDTNNLWGRVIYAK